jgi:tRNA G10  N-methylase Trm11
MLSRKMTQVETMTITQLTLDYRSEQIGQSHIVLADCLEWLKRIPENSIHAIVTDPPYGVKEYEIAQIEKMGRAESGAFLHHLMEALDLLCHVLLRLTRKSVRYYVCSFTHGAMQSFTHCGQVDISLSRAMLFFLSSFSPR